MTFQELHTKRLLLRKVTPEVHAYVIENYSTEEAISFFGHSDSEGLETEQKRYKSGLETFNRSILYFQLIDKETKNVIGWCGYHTWYKDHARAEIGYGLNEEQYKLKGLMTEAMQVVLRFGFEEMQLHRVEAFISPKNIASLKLAQKFGFTAEGCLREHYLKDGIHEDSAVFGLLRKEWAEINDNN